MRNIQGQTYRLKYHPFPSEKGKKEFIIGEALLRNKKISEEELATLRNVQDEAPDLAVTIKEFGELTIEVTESVPHERKDIDHSNRFIKELIFYLKELGTKPLKPSNIFIHRDMFAFPRIKSREIKSIAEKIDSFFKSEGFLQNYSIIHKLMDYPIEVTFVPAQGNFTSPAIYSENNLFIHDITGFPIDNIATRKAIQHAIQKKKAMSGTADILIIFHDILGIVGFDKVFDRIRKDLLSSLSYKGIYIVQIIPTSFDYWISVITIRDHPIFMKR